MKLLEKRMIIPHAPDRAPICAFVTYIHAEKPILLRRTGWEVSNDTQDDYTDVISRDNGRTWGDSRPAPSSIPVEGGFIVHTEHVALYLPDRNLLICWTNDKFEASLTAGYDMDQTARIRITMGDPDSVYQGTASAPFISDFGIKQGLYVSFATAFLDSHGRVLVPVMWQKNACPTPTRPLSNVERLGKRGFATRKDMPDVFSDVWEVGLLIGEFQRDGPSFAAANYGLAGGKLKWHVSQAVPFDLDQSSRGMHEGSIAELPDGRLCMILRGSNEGWPDVPGYKWLSFSQDGGETWSKVVPLPCDDGSLIESSCTGSGLFRSIKNGRLYWMGNLCLEGRRPEGNMPRSPLYIAEIQENPVAIKRKTITVIDRAQPGEHPDTQHSNFKFYQDRETGDIVLYFTRYGERGYENGRWIEADLYQYRVSLD